MEEDLENVPEAYRDAAEQAVATRLEAMRREGVGQTFVQMRLRNGQRHEGFTIQEITDEGILIESNDGTDTWIDAIDLPIEVQTQLGYDAAENQRMLRQEIAIAQVVAEGTVATLGDEGAAIPSGDSQVERTPSDEGYFEVSSEESRGGMNKLAFNSTVLTDATITVFGAISYPPDYVISFDLPNNHRVVNRVMVGSQYRAVLTTRDGQVLDVADHHTHPAVGGSVDLNE